MFKSTKQIDPKFVVDVVQLLPSASTAAQPKTSNFFLAILRVQSLVHLFMYRRLGNFSGNSVALEGDAQNDVIRATLRKIQYNKAMSRDDVTSTRKQETTLFSENDDIKKRK